MEAVIITPGSRLGLHRPSFVVFDAFRTYNTSIKATYAVADILSRQSNTVFPADIEGYTRIFEHWSVTMVTRGCGRRDLLRTRPTTPSAWNGPMPRTARPSLFTGNLVDLEGHLPVMADAERILLVETFIP